MRMSLDLSRSADASEPAATGTSASWGSARVLVVIPLPDGGAATLERALRSVGDQRDEPVDVVVVGPAGSEDGEVGEVARRHAARVLARPGRGAAAAVNAGLRAASSAHRYGTWLGVDDVLLPGAVRTAAAALDADPRAVLAFGDCRHESADGEYLFTPHTGARLRRLLGIGADPPVAAAMLFRLDAVTTVGGLDEDLRYAIDLDLVLRLRRLGRFAPTGRTLAAFRCGQLEGGAGVVGGGAGGSTATATVTATAAVAESRAVLARHLPEPLRPLTSWRAAARLTGRRALPGAVRAASWLEPAQPPEQLEDADRG